MSAQGITIFVNCHKKLVLKLKVPKKYRLNSKFKYLNHLYIGKGRHLFFAAIFYQSCFSLSKDKVSRTFEYCNDDYDK